MIQDLPIKKLKLLERNPRRINNEAMAKLVHSIDSDPDFLKHRPILVNLKDGVYEVYGGNQRVRAAKKLGWKEIPCSISEDLDEKTMKERIVKDNKTYGEFDYDILANEYDIDLLIDAGMNHKELSVDPSILWEEEKEEEKEPIENISNNTDDEINKTCPHCGGLI